MVDDNIYYCFIFVYFMDNFMFVWKYVYWMGGYLLFEMCVLVDLYFIFFCDVVYDFDFVGYWVMGFIGGWFIFICFVWGGFVCWLVIVE